MSIFEGADELMEQYVQHKEDLERDGGMGADMPDMDDEEGEGEDREQVCVCIMCTTTNSEGGGTSLLGALRFAFDIYGGSYKAMPW